jgi:DNA-binding NarL/FixJ family response regulator
LIVKDYKGVRVFLRYWLSDTFPGYHILKAKNGEEAVTLVQSKTPDIVLMDISLPRMKGIDTTRCIKEAILPKIHADMLTSHEDSKYQTDAAAARACIYVTKRKMQRELILVMTKLLFEGHEKRDELSGKQKERWSKKGKE